MDIRESTACAIREAYFLYLVQKRGIGNQTPWEDLSEERKEKWYRMADAAAEALDPLLG